MSVKPTSSQRDPVRTMAREQRHERTIMATDACVGLARGIVDGRLRAWGLEDFRDLRDNAVVVTSELVTNAREASGVLDQIRLLVVLNELGLTISVSDHSIERPTVNRSQITAEKIDNAADAGPHELSEFGGWGLWIVEQLSYECGYRMLWPTGKWVWARLKVS